MQHVIPIRHIVLTKDQLDEVFLGFVLQKPHCLTDFSSYRISNDTRMDISHILPSCRMKSLLACLRKLPNVTFKYVQRFGTVDTEILANHIRPVCAYFT